MFENKNVDEFHKHEIPISGYVEAILGRKQILQEKKKQTTLSQISCKICQKKIQKHKQ